MSAVTLPNIPHLSRYQRPPEPRGGPLLRAMRRFSHRKKSAPSSSPSPSAANVASPSNDTSDNTTSVVIENNSNNDSQQQQDFKAKASEAQSPQTLTITTMKVCPSSPVDGKSSHSSDCDRREGSVDWTNTTEATSFSEQEEVQDANGSHNELRNLKVSETFPRLLDASSTDSCCDSESCTLDTTECAAKVLEREEYDENRCSDNDDEDDDNPSCKDLPVVITLLNATEISLQPPAAASPTSTMQPNNELSPTEAQLRLAQAEAMIESYQNTLKSNEHLIESLEQTLQETREKVQDLWTERNRLEQELEETLDEQDKMMLTEKSGVIPRIQMAILAGGLVYFMAGGSEYILLFASIVYLLEDVLNMSL